MNPSSTPDAHRPRFHARGLVVYVAALAFCVFGLPLVARGLQPVDHWLMKRVTGPAAMAEARPQGNRY
ncbi:hypothetical protein NK718_00285 [Alsobacter sp. SYSU M60028]|uniref:Uncharacterized protein n=1 Tax=Alsobacter ponti TaxID=2962936 RepID=A0ABT1L794_9HYPH|nr:hypothetical protein [Alsobacter ponti]MCP8936941.1 hypothetical protein [Alsobacter ponti]